MRTHTAPFVAGDLIEVRRGVHASRTGAVTSVDPIRGGWGWDLAVRFDDGGLPDRAVVRDSQVTRREHIA